MHYETLISSISCAPVQSPHTLTIHVCIHLLQQHIESGWFVIFSRLLMHPLPKMPRSFLLTFLKACASSMMTHDPKDAAHVNVHIFYKQLKTLGLGIMVKMYLYFFFNHFSPNSQKHNCIVYILLQ